MFSKVIEKEVTVDDYRSKDYEYQQEFVSKDGHECLVEVIQDNDCESPRDGQDNLWTWITTSGAGYSDRRDDYPEDYNVKELKKTGLVLPLYLYRHSGDSIAVGSFKQGDPRHCMFDSGCMGFAYTSFEDVKAWLKVDNVDKDVQERCRRILEQEVDTMNAWLSGACYGIRIVDMVTDYEDCCWGYIVENTDDLIHIVEDMLQGWTDEAGQVAGDCVGRY